MEIADRLYGALDAGAPVIQALLQTQALRRLEGVLQHGVTALIGITRPVTRLEHSLGVMALVQRLGAGEAEQVAALLHDVSHTAFSHVVDYVFDRHEAQSYHEEHKEWFMASSDLPETLARFGYDWRLFLHEDDFVLLEQPAPALCADRLDYFLRDAYDLGLASLAEVQAALDSLAVYEGRIVCLDLAAARRMGDTYLAADQASWANFREVGLYELAAQAIRLGLQRGVIADADLWTTDAQVWARLQSCADAEIRRQAALVSPQTGFAWDAAAPDFWVSTKLRTIDPDVLAGGQLRRLSELDAAFAARREEYLHSKAGKWPVRVIPAG